MPLTCECGDDYDWFYEAPEDFGVLETKRARKCCSCGTRIALGDECGRFRCFRSPRHDVEESIYGDEVPMAPKFMCERCTGLYFSLEDLGFCITLSESMPELVKEYAEVYQGNAGFSSQEKT